jgi:hypothetical protein
MNVCRGKMTDYFSVENSVCLIDSRHVPHNKRTRETHHRNRVSSNVSLSATSSVEVSSASLRLLTRRIVPVKLSFTQQAIQCGRRSSRNTELGRFVVEWSRDNKKTNLQPRRGVAEGSDRGWVAGFLSASSARGGYAKGETRGRGRILVDVRCSTGYIATPQPRVIAAHASASSRGRAAVALALALAVALAARWNDTRVGVERSLPPVMSDDFLVSFIVSFVDSFRMQVPCSSPDIQTTQGSEIL